MTQVAAILAALILAGLICFQLLLATGLPLGHYAWGGAHRVLPRSLRIASVLATFIYLVASADLARNVVWALTGFFGIGIVMNAISRSVKERRMAFVALSLSGLCAVVALGL